MQKIYEFLKKANTYYLATDDEGQPRVRPFGTVNIYENKLYIQTGKVKEVYKQIKKNPRIEICAMLNNQWLRVAATAVEEDSLLAKQSLLDAYPSLQNRYKADDSNTAVFYLKDATAVISSFTDAPVEIKF